MLGSDEAPNLAVPDAHQQQQRNFLPEVTWTTMQRLRSSSDRSVLFLQTVVPLYLVCSCPDKVGKPLSDLPEKSP